MINFCPIPYVHILFCPICPIYFISPICLYLVYMSFFSYCSICPIALYVLFVLSVCPNYPICQRTYLYYLSYLSYLNYLWFKVFRYPPLSSYLSLQYHWTTRRTEKLRANSYSVRTYRVTHKGFETEKMTWTSYKKKTSFSFRESWI